MNRDLKIVLGILLGVALFIAVYLTAVFWKVEHDSCVRSDGTRAAIQIIVKSGAKTRSEEADSAGSKRDADRSRELVRQLDRAGIKAEQLSCNSVFPEAN